MKTIEEAAKESALEIQKNVDEIGASHIAIRCFKAGAKFSQQWIKIGKELPEEGCYVLVKFKEIGYYGHHWCSANYYHASQTFEVHNKNLVNFEITHWRPIELK